MIDTTFDDLIKSIAAATVTCTVLVSYGKIFLDGRLYLIACTLSIVMIIACFYDSFYEKFACFKKDDIPERKTFVIHKGSSIRRSKSEDKRKPTLDTIPEKQQNIFSFSDIKFSKQ